jgi:hypothetical protein
MLIVSMVAISARGPLLQRVIDSILSQTRVPDLVLVHYSSEPWHLDAGWSEPPAIRTHPLVELHLVPNLGSCRKYIFTLQRFRSSDCYIILVDDDRLWNPFVFERLVAFVSANDAVAVTRGWSKYRLVHNDRGEFILHDIPVRASVITQPTSVSVAASGWAMCLKPNYVCPKIFLPRLQRRYELSISDEVALSASIRRSKCVIPMSGEIYEDLITDRHLWLSRAATTAKLKQIPLLVDSVEHLQ